MLKGSTKANHNTGPSWAATLLQLPRETSHTPHTLQGTRSCVKTSHAQHSDTLEGVVVRVQSVMNTPTQLWSDVATEIFCQKKKKKLNLMAEHLHDSKSSLRKTSIFLKLRLIPAYPLIPWVLLTSIKTDKWATPKTPELTRYSWEVLGTSVV